jgi:ribosomal protein S18 acetylase RimI-like enzyme
MIITELKNEHISSIIDLSNEAFGYGFINTIYLTAYLSSTNKYCLVALNSNNQVIGFITTKTTNYNDFSTSFFEDEELKKYNNISIIKQVVVNKAYQNQQIASLLLKKVLEILVVNSNVIVCIAWNNNNRIALKNILERNLFNAIKSIPNYWYADSITNNYNCIRCGKPPCSCSAELYIKKNPSN